MLDWISGRKPKPAEHPKKHATTVTAYAEFTGVVPFNLVDLPDGAPGALNVEIASTLRPKVDERRSTIVYERSGQVSETGGRK